MGFKGRPRQSGKRDKRNRLIAERRVEPADYVTARRELWSFVTPTKGPEGRSGTIDQDICDGIGQFHALGLFDGQPVDGSVLRDIGREWRNHFVILLKSSGFKMGNYQRMDKARTLIQYTHADAKFDLMDDALEGYERHVLYSLLIDPIVGSWPNGEENAPWVQSLVCEGLLKLGRKPLMVRFPMEEDRERLRATIRGLFALYDASLPSRWEQRRVA